MDKYQIHIIYKKALKWEAEWFKVGPKSAIVKWKTLDRMYWVNSDFIDFFTKYCLKRNDSYIGRIFLND